MTEPSGSSDARNNRALADVVADSARPGAEADLLTPLEIYASIVDEIQGPLTVIALNSEACLRWLDRDSPNLVEALDAARQSIAAVLEAGKMIDCIRSLVAEEEQQKSAFDLGVAIRKAVEEIEHELGGLEAAPSVSLPTDAAIIVGNPTQMQQLFRNLFVNAAQAMKEQPGQKQLSVSCTRENHGFQVTVSDGGKAIGAGDRAWRVTPFFTTGTTGIGMGLPICQSIVAAHGGRMSARNSNAGGSVFNVWLPELERKTASSTVQRSAPNRMVQLTMIAANLTMMSVAKC